MFVFRLNKMAKWPSDRIAFLGQFAILGGHESK